MNTQTMKPPAKWTTRRDEKQRRLHEVAPLLNGIVLPMEEIVEALEALVERRDRIVMEGDNQKQADFLSRSLIQVDSGKIHDLHLIISSISRPKHLGLFELGIAKKVDFAFFAGPQSLRVSQLFEDGILENRSHSHVCRALRALVGRPDPQCHVRMRGTGGSGKRLLQKRRLCDYARCHRGWEWQ